MRFYFTVLITSSTLLASCDRINGSKPTTVSDMSSIDPADTNPTTVAGERMRLADNGTAAMIVEERTGPSSSAVAAVHAIESKWKRTPTAFPTRETGDLVRATELIQDIRREMTYQPSTGELEQFLIDQRSHYRHAFIIYALGEMKLILHPVAQYHRWYLEKLIDQGYTPYQVLSELNEKWVPSRSVLMNLNDYISMYNERFTGSPPSSMLATLKEYLENDYDLALVMSHLKRHGDVEEHLYSQLATYYAQNFQLDHVYELLRPKNGETEWNFEMLHYVFLASGRDIDDLLRFLQNKFGGIRELAPILAGADELDMTSKKLHFKLVLGLAASKAFNEVVHDLNLEVAELTRNNLKTLKMYTELKNRRGAQIDWRQRLAAIRGVDVREIPVFFS